MHSIWAIARLTILMTMRKRAGLILVLFLVIGIPVISLFAQGDNTLIGLLRLVINYNFGVMSGLLMFMVIYLAATVLDNEIVEKQIFVLDVKPVPRWQVLLGKWLGLALVLAWFILIMGIMTYVVIMAFTVLGRLASSVLAPTAGIAALMTIGWGGIHFLFLRNRQRAWWHSVLFIGWLIVGIGLCGQHLTRATKKLVYQPNTRSLAGRKRFTPEQINTVHQQLLVGRRVYHPEMPDLETAIRRKYRALVAQGVIEDSPRSRHELAEKIAENLKKKTWPIRFQGQMTFQFKHLPLADDINTSVTLRYKLHGRRGDASGGWLDHAWYVYSPGSVAYQRVQRSKSGKSREFHIDANVISRQGNLSIGLVNQSGPTAAGGAPAQITVPLDDGIVILVPTASFESNFARGLILLWVRLAMLAAIGIAANTYLRGSVTAFLLLGVIAVGTMNTFVYKKVSQTKPAIHTVGGKSHSHADHDDVLTAIVEKLSLVLPRMLEILPNFDDTDPVTPLVAGREISLRELLLQAFYDIGLRAGLMVLIGVVAFNRREVGLPVIV